MIPFPGLGLVAVTQRKGDMGCCSPGLPIPRIVDGILSIAGLFSLSPLYPWVTWSMPDKKDDGIAKLLGLSQQEASDGRLWALFGIAGNFCPRLLREFEVRSPSSKFQCGDEVTIPAVFGFDPDAVIKLKCTGRRGHHRLIWTAYLPIGYKYSYQPFMLS